MALWARYDKTLTYLASLLESKKQKITKKLVGVVSDFDKLKVISFVGVITSRIAVSKIFVFISYFAGYDFFHSYSSLFMLHKKIEFIGNSSNNHAEFAELDEVELKSAWLSKSKLMPSFLALVSDKSSNLRHKSSRSRSRLRSLEKKIEIIFNAT